MLELIPSGVKPKVNINGKIKPHFYVINFASDEENLCKMEMKYLFQKTPKEKYFFSYHYIDPSRSPFIKLCISIMYAGETLNDIINQLIADKASYENFKVSYINYNDENLGYKERRKIEYEIGQNINGEAEMKNPELLLGITKVDKKWILGEYKRNEPEWIIHNKKPYSYSNAITSRAARAIVNIAVSNNLKCEVVDPCCGIGTIVMEALSIGINIKGFELNPLIAANAKTNLQYFDYRDVIVNGNMHDIKDRFHVGIIDLPYGLFSATTLKEQIDIIKTSRRICDKAVIITLENMDKYFLSAGFEIIDKCYISKGKFKRHITICK